MKILTINPGSTSTKLALFSGTDCLWKAHLAHDKNEISRLTSFASEKEFRKKIILNELAKRGVDLKEINAISARGGLLAPVEGGTYTVNQSMLNDLTSCKHGKHASNFGAVIASELADVAGIPAFIVDPPVVDELEPVAVISGLPEISRRSLFHALNQKAVARVCAQEIGISYEKGSFIVAHMGGGISVGAHRHGRVIDVNNALEGEGPMSPERSGGLPAGALLKLATGGKADPEELMEKITRKGGIHAYLGTNSFTEVLKRAANGDEKAKLIVDAMAYQVAKEIASLSPVLKGKIDAIVLTGGLSESGIFVNLIRERVDFLAKVVTVPQMEEAALAAGALRILGGEEKARAYRG